MKRVRNQSASCLNVDINEEYIEMGGEASKKRWEYYEIVLKRSENNKIQAITWRLKPSTGENVMSVPKPSFPSKMAINSDAPDVDDLFF